jgi:hypothetical protein
MSFSLQSESTTEWQAISTTNLIVSPLFLFEDPEPVEYLNAQVQPITAGIASHYSACEDLTCN